MVQYLHHNADFFEHHPQLLARLRLQHPRNGSTVSLIERQVEVLREKIQAQEQKLAEFVRVARANNVLAEKIHRFTRRLLRTSGPRPAIAEIEASLREDFDTFHAVLVLREPRRRRMQDPSCALPAPRGRRRSGLSQLRQPVRRLQAALRPDPRYASANSCSAARRRTSARWR